MFSCLPFSKDSIIRKLRIEQSKYILRKLKNYKYLPKVFKNDLDNWVKNYKFSSGKVPINETQFLVYKFDELYHTSVKIVEVP
jgi:hypothetical protein